MEAVNIKDQEQPLFDQAMRAKIIEREKDIEEHPDDWIDYKESIQELRENLWFNTVYTFAKKTQADLQQIKYYIQNILQNQKAADDFIDAVEEKYLTILKEPHLQPNEWVNNRLYYGALVKKYIIAYYMDEPTKTVVITAVRHTRQKRKYF